MTDITLFELLTRLPDLQSCRSEFGWGWFEPKFACLATDFVSYEDGNLVCVVPYVILTRGRRRVYCVNNYCVGQKTNTGKISPAYQWEERLAGHGITPELIKKIKYFLETENK